MRSLVPKLLTLSIVALLACACAASASAAPAVTGNFPLGSEIETNNKIVAGPDGNVWFTLPGKKIGDITPAGIVREFELAKIENTIGIASGPEGRMWVVSTGKVLSFLPSNPEGTEQLFESALINAEPNIVLGPEGLFWVASNNKVAKFSPADFKGTIAEVPVKGELSPKDIDVAGSLIVISDNNANLVTELGRIVTFTSAGTQRDIAIPGTSQGLSGAPDGQIAYSAAGAKPEQSGLITPPAPASAFELVGDPFGVAYGSDQAFWIVQFAKGGLTRLSSTGATTFVGGIPIETARQVAAGPDNTLWVTVLKNELKGQPTPAIARVSGLEPPVTTTTTTTNLPAGGTTTTPPAPKPPVPNTVFAKGTKKVFTSSSAKATVAFKFSSTVAGATFQCSLNKTPAPQKGKKKKAPTALFAGCASPKVLHLVPGKYRFAVRSVAGGVTDASPAETAFTVVHKAKRPRHR
jgi:streptogramin lyase